MNPGKADRTSVSRLTEITGKGVKSNRDGTRGGGRTHNLWLRRPALYPIELRARQVKTGKPNWHRRPALGLSAPVRLSFQGINVSAAATATLKEKSRRLHSQRGEVPGWIGVTPLQAYNS